MKAASKEDTSHYYPIHRTLRTYVIEVDKIIEKSCSHGPRALPRQRRLLVALSQTLFDYGHVGQMNGIPRRQLQQELRRNLYME